MTAFWAGNPLNRHSKHYFNRKRAQLAMSYSGISCSHQIPDWNMCGSKTKCSWKITWISSSTISEALKSIFGQKKARASRALATTGATTTTNCLLPHTWVLPEAENSLLPLYVFGILQYSIKNRTTKQPSAQLGKLGYFHYRGTSADQPGLPTPRMRHFEPGGRDDQLSL